MPPAEESAAPSNGGVQHDGEPTRILIIEDHLVVAEGLTALINHQADMKVVGNVGTVAECVPAAAELDPDVVLIDFRLPDGTGPDAAMAIRSLRPAAKMIFLTREDTDAARFAAVQSGASAFIHKSKAAADVVSTIRDVARGKMLITPRTIASLLAKRKSIESQLAGKRLPMVTPVEKQPWSSELGTFMSPPPARLTNSMLMASLERPSSASLAPCARILGSKLAVHSKLEAIVKARELGLIS